MCDAVLDVVDELVMSDVVRQVNHRHLIRIDRHEELVFRAQRLTLFLGVKGFEQKVVAGLPLNIRHVIYLSIRWLHTYHALPASSPYPAVIHATRIRAGGAPLLSVPGSQLRLPRTTDRGSFPSTAES